MAIAKRASLSQMTQFDFERRKFLLVDPSRLFNRGPTDTGLQQFFDHLDLRFDLTTDFTTDFTANLTADLPTDLTATLTLL